MKPVIGITTGCPCGIGPEIVAKAVKDDRVLKICEPRVFGVVPDKSGNYVVAPFMGPDKSGNYVVAPFMGPDKCGSISMAAVDDAVRAAMQGEVAAIVTAPVNKAHWVAAGSPFLGHTEYLAHVSGAKSVAMMMASPKLKVALVTTHIPLSEVPRAISIERIYEVARLVNSEIMKIVKLADPASRSEFTKIAVCALNPHAGESGHMGTEEEKVIIPAIRILQGEGLDISGPYPADTVFHRAANGEFGAVVAMYHDQGLSPIKTLDFDRTVNVTLGLPFVRTSPDHGTAEDIAGKGVASHENMVEAIRVAVKMCTCPIHRAN